ncbi:MAG: DNA (cytosine-5-)-methyltransferase [Acidipropionibacterium jensenii]|nr:DNA (cytosine-5-)-methyltransferase [Acidipropionibacterium jensenii]
MTLTIGSLFAGYGGLDLGIGQVLDAEPAWFCEWDEAPSKILAHHWPDVPNFRDVTTVDWSAIPPVDIITGGSPCQDLSLAGARRGMTDGTRSNLWVAMREAIATIRPRLVVWENVRGALSATATSESDMEPGEGLLGGGTGHLRALGRVLGDLATIGYDARWALVRASDVGAPHHRARVFLVAYPADTGSVGLQAARRGSGPAASLAGPVGGAGTLPALNHLPTPNASDGTGGGQVPDKRTGHSRQLIDAVLDLGGQPYLQTPAVSDGNGGKSTKHVGGTRPSGTKRSVGLTDVPVLTAGDSVFGKYEPVVHRWEHATGMESPVPTELNKNGRPRLNAAFAEFMMGLPPGWVTQVPGVTRAQQLKACGNGVVPQQAAAALRHLLE